MTSPTLNQIERACADLARDGHPVTIAAVADRASIARSTIYRNPELRAIIEHHRQAAPRRQHHHDHRRTRHTPRHGPDSR